MPPYTTESADSDSRGQIAVTVVVVALAVVLNFLPAPAQQQVASALRSTVLRPFVMTQEGLAEARVRATESSRLRARLDSMVAATVARSHLEEENRRLRGLLSLSDRIGAGFVGASVVRPGTAGSESMFVVDVGSRDSVRARAPVITRHGLVGVVREAREESAIGMDWTHPDFRASAMSLDGTVSGIVESHRGDFREQDRLVLRGTPFHATLDRGTVIVTSGLGGVYPRGIPIGRIRGMAESDAGWRKSYWLEPFVRPADVTYVLVAATDVTAPSLPEMGVVWPEDSIVDEEALARRERRRADSLAAVADSLRMLRAILAARRAQDSLRRAVTGDTVAPPGRPAPPDASPVAGDTTSGRGSGSEEERTGGPGAPRPGEEGPGQGGGETGGGEGAGGAAVTDTPPPAGDSVLPERVLPGALRPDTSLLETVRPDTGRPDTTRPDTTGIRPGGDPGTTVRAVPPDVPAGLPGSAPPGRG